MTNPNDSIMSRIMKLLNLANDTAATPAERALAEEQAERLMAKHMIDRFEAEQKAKNMGDSIRKPIQDEWEVDMGSYQPKDSKGNAEFNYQVLNMMQCVLRHCNIRVNNACTYAKVKVNAGTAAERMATDPYRRVYKIVGFPEDIAYAERIWFNVFRTFVSNVNPGWDINADLGKNAYEFASAGISWKEQVLIAEAAGDERLERPWRYQGQDRSKPFYSSFQAGSLIDPGNEAWGRSIHKLKRNCKKYCTDNNLEYSYSPGSNLRISSRNSFARSYKNTIAFRLDEIREKAEHNSEVDRDKFALALLDTKDRVDQEFYRLFPEFDPDVQAKKRQEEEFLKACTWAAMTPDEQERVLREEAKAQADWERRKAQARRSYRTVRSNHGTAYDNAAWLRGKAAAETVNLRNDGEVKKQNTKGIE